MSVYKDRFDIALTGDHDLDIPLFILMINTVLRVGMLHPLLITQFVLLETHRYTLVN